MLIRTLKHFLYLTFFLLSIRSYPHVCQDYLYKIIGRNQIVLKNAQELSFSQSFHSIVHALALNPEHTEILLNNPHAFSYVFFKHLDKGIHGGIEPQTATMLFKNAYGMDDEELKLLDEAISGGLDPQLQMAIISTTKKAKDSELQDAKKYKLYAKYLEMLLEEPSTQLPAETLSQGAKSYMAKLRASIKKLSKKMRNLLRQLMKTPSDLIKIRRGVQVEMQYNNLDHYLYAMRGFRDFKKGEFSARPWSEVKISPNDMRPEQIIGVKEEEFIKVLKVAMEIEEPIEGYSLQTGMGLQYVLPTLGEFTGRNEMKEAVYRYHMVNGIPKEGKPVKTWKCDGVWCREENRHANIFSKMIEALEKIAPDRSNHNLVNTVPLLSRQDAANHLIGRVSTEWDASSVYFWMIAHSTDSLREGVRRVLRDEIKHFTIFSNGDFYLNGSSGMRRLTGMMKKALKMLFYHKGARTSGSATSGYPDFISSLQVIMTHLPVEAQMQRYLQTVPHRTRKYIFDTAKPATLEIPPGLFPEGKDSVQFEYARYDWGSRKEITESIQISKDDFAAYNRKVVEEWNRRQRLLDYPKKERELLFRMYDFEKSHSQYIEATIKTIFKNFEGSERINSDASDSLILAIEKFVDNLKTDDSYTKFSRADRKLLKRIFYERLRHYQILSSSELGALNPANIAR